MTQHVIVSFLDIGSLFLAKKLSHSQQVFWSALKDESYVHALLDVRNLKEFGLMDKVALAERQLRQLQLDHVRLVRQNSDPSPTTILGSIGVRPNMCQVWHIARVDCEIIRSLDGQVYFRKFE